jgi:hypothetical protein
VPDAALDQLRQFVISRAPDATSSEGFFSRLTAEINNEDDVETSSSLSSCSDQLITAGGGDRVLS